MDDLGRSGLSRGANALPDAADSRPVSAPPRLRRAVSSGTKLRPSAGDDADAS